MVIIFAVGIGVLGALAILEVERVLIMIVATAYMTVLLIIATTIDKENKLKK